MTAPNSNFRKRIYEHMSFPISSATSVNTGDMVYIASHYALVCDTDTKAAAFAGVSNDTNPVTSLGDAQTKIRVNRHDTFEFNTTSGDTYYQGDVCYVGADAQTITNTVGGNTHAVGYVVLPDGVASLAYSSGAKVQVAITPQFMPLA